MNKFLNIFLIIMLIITAGCTTLRKKFTRKKKYEKTPPVYLDYKKYPDKPNKEAYINYYLFLRGWLEEFVIGLEKSMFKKQKRSINEALMNLEQMMACYNLKGQETVMPIYQDLRVIRDKIEKETNISEMRKNQIIDKIKIIFRKVEANCKYSNAKKWMDI